MKRMLIIPVWLTLVSFPVAEAQQSHPGKVWTKDHYPSYVRRLTWFGERADWSHDGKKILFVGRTFGDVYEVEVETGIITPVTHHYYHGGYTRALYLSNGDILLSGPAQFNPAEHYEWRRWQCELWVLDKSLTKPPVKLGTYCFEGPCVSRTKPRIAWTQNYGQESRPTGRFVIWMADIDYSTGKPQLANQRMVIDNTHPAIEGAVLENQNFRPPLEDEIIFQSTLGVETFGVHLETGKVTNYSLAPDTHEEPEGIYPDGQYTLVESDREASTGEWPRNIDFYRLALDGSGETQRLSFFAESGKWRGTNPVVSDDGRFIAFQVSPSGAEAGVGTGIYIYDIEKAENASRQHADLEHVSKQLADVVFRYDTVTGIGHERGCTRRDPSDIIKVGDTWYVWYTKVYGRSPGYWGTVWYAVSDDEGFTWQEKGEALGTGTDGHFDAQAVFTPNILYADGRYYLFYTGVRPTTGRTDGVFENNSTTDITAIGVAASDSPDGPFRRLHGGAPILEISPRENDFDSYRIDDAVLLVRDGRYWLYYKGRSLVHGQAGPSRTKMGVAFSDTPEGPYTKCEHNPILDKSHEVMIWKQGGGVACLASLSSTLEYASDGLDFTTDALNIEIPDQERPRAPGAYRPDLVDKDAGSAGLTWGISMVHNGDEAYLVRWRVLTK